MPKKDYGYKIVPAHPETHADIKRLSKRYHMTMADFLACLVEDHKEVVEEHIEEEK